MIQCMPHYKVPERFTTSSCRVRDLVTARTHQVYIPGEISLQTFEFVAPVRVYVSESNPGAKAMMQAFKAQYPRDQLLTLV
jgi:hypothetical protein